MLLGSSTGNHRLVARSTRFLRVSKVCSCVLTCLRPSKGRVQTPAGTKHWTRRRVRISLARSGWRRRCNWVARTGRLQSRLVVEQASERASKQAERQKERQRDRKTAQASQSSLEDPFETGLHEVALSFSSGSASFTGRHPRPLPLTLRSLARRRDPEPRGNRRRRTYSPIPLR